MLTLFMENFSIQRIHTCKFVSIISLWLVFVVIYLPRINNVYICPLPPLLRTSIVWLIDIPTCLHISNFYQSIRQLVAENLCEKLPTASAKNNTILWVAMWKEENTHHRFVVVVIASLLCYNPSVTIYQIDKNQKWNICGINAKKNYVP